MNSIKTLLILGFVFVANGITFLIVGLASHLTPLWTLGPVFIALGVVFLAISRYRKNSLAAASSASGGGA